MTQVPENSSAQSKSQSPLVIRVATEFIATLFAMFAIYTLYSLSTAMYGINVLMIAICTGVAYAASTIIAARISGGHLNPAVTVASMLTGRTSYLAGLCYIVAQVLGAIAAAGLFVFILPQTQIVKDTNWFAPVVNGFEDGSISASQLKSVNASFGIITAFVVEVIAAALVIATAISQTKDNGKTRSNYAVSMGLAYAAGTFMTYQITGSGLNPARSTGIAVFTITRDLAVKPYTQLWAFWIAPIFAAALVGFVTLLTKLLTTSANLENRKSGYAHAKNAANTMVETQVATQVATPVETPVETPVATQNYGDNSYNFAFSQANNANNLQGDATNLSNFQEDYK